LLLGGGFEGHEGQKGVPYGRREDEEVMWTTYFSSKARPKGPPISSLFLKRLSF